MNERVCMDVKRQRREKDENNRAPKKKYKGEIELFSGSLPSASYAPEAVASTLLMSMPPSIISGVTDRMTCTDERGGKKKGR